MAQPRQAEEASPGPIFYTAFCTKPPRVPLRYSCRNPTYSPNGTTSQQPWASDIPGGAGAADMPFSQGRPQRKALKNGGVGDWGFGVWEFNV